MSETYSIICNARMGQSLGVQYLALVDRGLCKSLWWTSDNPAIMIKYQSIDAAEFALSRLKKNRPSIMKSSKVAKIISNQRREIENRECHEEAMDSMESGWDGHKCWV